MIVYLATNTVNGKMYVGVTKYTLDIRFKRGHLRVTERKPTPFIYALRKYGIDSFKLEILEAVSTEEEMYSREIFWIAKLNCIVPEGYNLTAGGKGMLNPSDETKQRHSEASKGRVVSEETRRKISDSQKNKVVDSITCRAISIAKQGHKNKPHSKETKNKMAIACARNTTKRKYLKVIENHRLIILNSVVSM